MAKKKSGTLLCEIVLKGILCKASNGHESLLGLMLTESPEGKAWLGEPWEVVILAEAVDRGYWYKNCWASVSYYISDKLMSEDELQENYLRTVLGDATVDYGVHSSELTGYLWTDEDFVVGGHDLIQEWRGQLGKHLFLKAEFHSKAPKGKGVQ